MKDNEPDNSKPMSCRQPSLHYLTNKEHIYGLQRRLVRTTDTAGTGRCLGRLMDYLAKLEQQATLALAMAEELKDGMIDINRELDALLKQQEEQA